jgi:hypothetical protein
VAQHFQLCDQFAPNLTDVIPNRAEGPVRNLLLIFPALQPTLPARNREGHEFTRAAQPLKSLRALAPEVFRSLARRFFPQPLVTAGASAWKAALHSSQSVEG